MTDTRTETGETHSLRRTFLLMTTSSFLVPAAGVLTSPLLALALGVAGRGELAAALAPQALAISVATLGLPEAVTYYVAKHPRITKRALSWSAFLSVAAGILFLAVCMVVLPFLSADNSSLGKLIVLATALAIPTLIVGVMRGAASGRQMWTAVAVERVVGTVLRVCLLGALLALGKLTVVSAVWVTSLAPIVAGLAYWRVWTSPRAGESLASFEGNLQRAVTSFGLRMWLGAVASMLLARIGQILFAPLSSVYELGLFSVATTISDVPLIIALAIRDAVYGVNTKVNNARMVTATSRTTMLIGSVGCLILGGTLPLWLGLVFGKEFEAALVPTCLLMVGAVICIPGLLASAGLSAWGRPGLRSVGLGITVVITIPVLVLLIPRLGAVGGALTSIVSNVFCTSFMVVAASRVMKVPAADFVAIRIGDVVWVYRETVHLLRTVGSRIGRAAHAGAPSAQK